ncbi:MAG: hypothetical protein RR625_01020 [Christensenellaceae bacterium]
MSINIPSETVLKGYNLQALLFSADRRKRSEYAIIVSKRFSGWHK